MEELAVEESLIRFQHKGANGRVLVLSIKQEVPARLLMERLEDLQPVPTMSASSSQLESEDVTLVDIFQMQWVRTTRVSVSAALSGTKKGGSVIDYELEKNDGHWTVLSSQIKRASRTASLNGTGPYSEGRRSPK